MKRAEFLAHPPPACVRKMGVHRSGIKITGDGPLADRVSSDPATDPLGEAPRCWLRVLSCGLREGSWVIEVRGFIVSAWDEHGAAPASRRILATRAPALARSPAAASAWSS
jgi:hypothetical protein